MILQTARLALTELTPADAPFILTLLNSPGFLHNIGDRGIRDIPAAEAYIARVRASYAAHSFGMWRCDLLSDATTIGIVGFVKRDSLPHPDIGYALLEPFWNLGYATEATAACLACGRQSLGLSTVLAITTTHNAASIAVLRKIGLHPAGLIRLPNSADDSALFTT